MMKLGLRHRPNLLAAAAVGVLTVFVCWLTGVPAPSAMLVGWCALVLTYAGTTGVAMRRATPAELRDRAELLDESEGVVLVACLGAALASLGAVGWSLLARSTPADSAAAVMALVTIVLSWLFVHLLFAVRYTHEYWQAGGGLDFSGSEEPVFTDFLYFAFTIGMTFQTSDVAVSARAMRQLTLIHALVAFVFNMVIIGAAVNVAAGLAG